MLQFDVMVSTVAPLTSWIWWDGEPSPRNAHLCFRKKFQVRGRPSSMPVRISADSRYVLYLNGRPVCRGPARYYPEHLCVDEVDLAPHLIEGENLAAVHVHHYGEDTYDYIHMGQGGLAVESEALRTDGTWKVKLYPNWVRETARLNTRLGFQEFYDARRDPGFERWTDLSCDDTGWTRAVSLKPEQIRWSGEERRDIPFLAEEYEPFTKLHSAYAVRSDPDSGCPRNLANEVRSLQFLREDERLAAAVRAGMESGSGISLGRMPDDGESAALLFELPTQRTGFPFLEVAGRGGEEILWSYAELLHWNRFHQDAHPEALYGDLYIAAPGERRWRTFFPRSFRYVLVVIRNVTQGFAIQRLGFVRTSYPVDPSARFECSDDRLNRIWQVSLDTQANAMAADAYVDSFRERAQWWGTGVIAPIRFNAYLGADLSLARRGIRQAAQSQREDGQILANFPNRIPVPAETGEKIGLVLPDYSLQWIQTLWDYSWYSGDAGPLSEHWEALKRLLAWYEPRLADNGLLRPMPDYWVFLDWKTNRHLNQRMQSASLNLFYAMALDNAARIATMLGKEEEGRKYREDAGRLKRAVMAAAYDPTDGYLHEYIDGGRRLERVSLHANVLGILAELPGLDREALAKKMFSGLVGYSYWDGPDDADIGFYVFVFEAMCRTGRVAKALELARSRWGAMLDSGAANWWEFWSYDLHVRAGGAMSVAWGVSPCLVMMEWMLGFRPTAPGFREFEWAPHPCDVAESRAVIPTAAGLFRLTWKKSDTGIAVEADVPAASRGRLRVGSSERPLPAGSHSFHLSPS